MYSVTKTVVISAAHFLPGHSGKCKNMHGHNFKITVTLINKGILYETGMKKGMVEDFGTIKKTIMFLDHTLLNDHIQNPTAENIARYIANRFGNCERVEVEETPGNVACYTP